jgi:mRNA-degrading endonuclease RelE of RelBE toxin-antitoxin system
MATRHPFEIIYAPVVKDHLRVIEPKHHSLIRGTIAEQLHFEPDAETRNRKPLTRPLVFEADWELRFGPKNRFRVFYTVNPERREVYILAIGVKERKRLFIGREEIEL